MKVGIVGCGTIGTAVAKAMEKIQEVGQTYILDHKTGVAKSLEVILSKTQVIDKLEDLVRLSDVVVEAASQDAAREVLPEALAAGKDVVVMSVGVFVDMVFQREMEELAQKNCCKIFLPSGAVCGIDGLAAASEGTIRVVEMISVKPPAALKDVKYLQERKVDLDAISQPTVVYKGPASEAVKLFPKNINVAASVSLAGIGFHRTLVTIIADPSATENVHKIVAQGNFGKFVVELQNVPSPKNPRTSYLAVLSAVAAVKKIVGTTWFGA
jgi:aspartate dehydrogenase